MASSKHRPIGAPTPPDLPASLDGVSGTRFVEHSTWDEVEVVDADLALLEAVEPRLSRVRISGGDVGDGRIVHLTLEDGELSGLNAAGVKAEGAVLRRARLHLLRLTGANLASAELYDVTLSECRADYLSLNRARVFDAHFVDCNLREVDLTGARLERVRFDRCDLSGAEFAGADLRRCEMRGCALDGAKGIAALSGVAMPWPDIVSSAGIFAGALGITPIQEDDR